MSFVVLAQSRVPKLCAAIARDCLGNVMPTPRPDIGRKNQPIGQLQCRHVVGGFDAAEK